MKARYRSWERAVIGWMEYVTNPVLAGAAFTILCLGVVTWLPALAAVAFALQRWRDNGDSRCFVGVFTGWTRFWRRLLAHSVASTVAIALLVSNMIFLSGRSGALALGLFTLHIGLIAIAVIYHLALAVCAGRRPDDEVRTWQRAALALAFGSVSRGTALLGAAIAAPILSMVVPAGPLLLGCTIPVLVGLVLADHA